MQELWNAAFEAVNIPYTLMLGFVLMYWLSVVLGAVDVSGGDVDVDVDLDMDADVDGDIGGISSALHFFNFGKVPFMFLMTVVILSAWSMAVMSNHYWGDYHWPFALAMFGPILFVSLLIAKFVTTPLIPFFEQLNKASIPVDYIGQLCEVKLTANYEKFGQAEVRIDDNFLLIDVKTTAPEISLPRGTTAVVVGRTQDKKHFLIERRIE